MIVVACAGKEECQRCYRAVGDSNEVDILVGRRSDFWPDRYVCPGCGGKAQAFYEGTVPVENYFVTSQMTPSELFRALMGVGLPEELRCSLEDMNRLFREQPVKRLAGSPIEGSERFSLEFIELWDGTRVHIAPSGFGVSIYRVVRPTRAADRVLREVDRGR